MLVYLLFLLPSLTINCESCGCTGKIHAHSGSYAQIEPNCNSLVYLMPKERFLAAASVPCLLPFASRLHLWLLVTWQPLWLVRPVQRCKRNPFLNEDSLVRVSPRTVAPCTAV